ncbi:hypothetical protein [Fibrella arboris]|uniref:hypothetical protein n=1 Tax=Fibrella arboris TaxID=3242486 RepID=UPI003520853F
MGWRLGKWGSYLKNADVIEQLSGCDTIVFDKTGTLTTPASEAVTEVLARPLTNLEQATARTMRVR